MDNLEKFLEDLDRHRQELAAAFKIDELKIEIEDLRRQMEASDFWQDQERAIAVSRRAETLQKDYQRWLDLERSIAESRELAYMASSEKDAKLLAELSAKALKLSADLGDLENLSLYTGSYDESDALLSINAGTGGVDAQDWAQMLERMYLRFAERQAWKAEIIDRILANEAGIKSVMLKITGARAYGNLRSENGTHRLLRNSPFNADGLRQTSFASVEVIPEIPANDIVIKDEDVRLDVFRSSGPGGQSVNTTDSAVRLVHLPTGITVSCQTERSQHQNRDNAFSILRARLAKLELEKKDAEEKRLKGGVVKAEWGQQIRSYWFYGNRLVKDHRSNWEDTDVDGVMDGHLDEFVTAYLRWQKDNV
ncbi:MAG: peptide chain release factor 2 [Patescibacteria group bacterium]|nr:peptide chain release factor 2 [Patescibacteria group bacterium]